MTAQENGQDINGSVGMAHQHSPHAPASGITDDSEPAVTEVHVDRDQEAAAGPRSGSGSEMPDILYDAGWTKKSGFNMRVRWYGVPDDGSRRRWVSNVLLRHSRNTAQD